MIAAEKPDAFISRNYTDKSAAENQRIINLLFDEGKYNKRNGFKFAALHTKQSDGAVDGNTATTLPLSADIEAAKNIIGQYLAKEKIALNDQELLGNGKDENRNKLCQIFEKVLHIHVWDDFLKKNPTHTRAQDLKNKHSTEAKTFIDHSTQSKSYTDMDVYGDGHCWYYATLASLFHTIITGEIPEDSETAARLRAPNGFFDQVKTIYERENPGKTLALKHRDASPESLKDSLNTILNAYKGNFYDCFAGVCAPALQTIIYNHVNVSDRAQFTPAVARQFKEWLVNNETNLAKIASLNAMNDDQLFPLYQEDAKQYRYKPEQKKDNSYVEGGAFQGYLLENILNITIKSFVPKNDLRLPAPEPKKPTLYVANTGGHYHAGLTHIKHDNTDVQRFTEQMMNSIRPRPPAETKPAVSAGNNTASTFGKSAAPKPVGEISASASRHFAQRFEQSLKSDTRFLQTFSTKIGYTPDKIKIDKDKDAYNITTPDATGKSEKLLLRVEPTCVAAYGTLLNAKGPEATARALLETFKKSAPGMTEIIITTKNDTLREAIERIAAEPNFQLTVVPERSATPGLSH